MERYSPRVKIDLHEDKEIQKFTTLHKQISFEDRKQIVLYENCFF